MKYKSLNSSGFTLVELIIGMTIFAIGLSAVYALLQSTMGNALYSRHEIVVANLLRERIELVKNIRDTNIRNFLPWDSAQVQVGTLFEPSFSSGIYLVENNFTHSGVLIDPTTGRIGRSPILMKRLDTLPTDTGAIWEATKLSTDAQGRYTYADTGTGTPYAGYVRLIPLGYTDGNGTMVNLLENTKPQGYIIDARIIIKTGGIYREYDARSMMTNWIK